MGKCDGMRGEGGVKMVAVAERPKLHAEVMQEEPVAIGALTSDVVVGRISTASRLAARALTGLGIAFALLPLWSA